MYSLGKVTQFASELRLPYGFGVWVTQKLAVCWQFSFCGIRSGWSDYAGCMGVLSNWVSMYGQARNGRGVCVTLLFMLVVGLEGAVCVLVCLGVVGYGVRSDWEFGQRWVRGWPIRLYVVTYFVLFSKCVNDHDVLVMFEGGTDKLSLCGLGYP